MAGVRDPAFWKRFSVAVHMDEEQGEKLGAQYKDPYVNRPIYTPIPQPNPSEHLTNAYLQRLMARPPKQQEKEPHHGLLVLLDLLHRLRHRCRRRDHLVSREWHFRQAWTEHGWGCIMT